MALSRETVEHLARLAHVGLDSSEIDRLSAQVTAVLEHVSRLQQISTEGVPPTAQAISTENVWREDEVRPSWPPAAVLANAPHKSHDFFEVQAVFED